MEIIKGRFENWTDNVQRALRYATLPGGFLVWYARAFPHSETILAVSEKQIMGWAFLLEETHNNTVNLNLFVNKRYRGNGVAKVLVKEALKEHEIITLYAWNPKTWKLFRKLRRKYPGRVSVLNWWRHQGKYVDLVNNALSD